MSSTTPSTLKEKEVTSASIENDEIITAACNDLIQAFQQPMIPNMFYDAVMQAVDSDELTWRLLFLSQGLNSNQYGDLMYTLASEDIDTFMNLYNKWYNNNYILDVTTILNSIMTSEIMSQHHESTQKKLEHLVYVMDTYENDTEAVFASVDLVIGDNSFQQQLPDNSHEIFMIYVKALACESLALIFFNKIITKYKNAVETGVFDKAEKIGYFTPDQIQDIDKIYNVVRYLWQKNKGQDSFYEGTYDPDPEEIAFYTMLTTYRGINGAIFLPFADLCLEYNYEWAEKLFDWQENLNQYAQNLQSIFPNNA